MQLGIYASAFGETRMTPRRSARVNHSGTGTALPRMRMQKCEIPPENLQSRDSDSRSRNGGVPGLTFPRGTWGYGCTLVRQPSVEAFGACGIARLRVVRCFNVSLRLSYPCRQYGCHGMPWLLLFRLSSRLLRRCAALYQALHPPGHNTGTGCDRRQARNIITAAVSASPNENTAAAEGQGASASSIRILPWRAG